MNILAINGSHRGGHGATGHLLDVLAAGARGAGAEFDSVALARATINRCRGCFACTRERSFLHCIFEEKDDVRGIHERMRAADLLIYASPVYIFGISSLLKSFLERFMSTANCADFRVTASGLLFHHVDPALCAKPFVVLVTCDNMEDETPRSVVSYFRTFGRFMDAPLRGTLVRPTAQGLMLAREGAHGARYPYASDVFEAFRQAGGELATRGRISRRTERRARRSIIPIPAVARLLMKLNLRAVKRVAAARAHALAPTAPPADGGG
jgi:multimeric flavodoxin WrbA